MYHQQLAIPIDEFVRLENKFNNKEENFINPDIIILNNELSFINKIEIDKIFCEVFIRYVQIICGKKFNLRMWQLNKILDTLF